MKGGREGEGGGEGRSGEGREVEGTVVVREKQECGGPVGRAGERGECGMGGIWKKGRNRFWHHCRLCVSCPSAGETVSGGTVVLAPPGLVADRRIYLRF